MTIDVVIPNFNGAHLIESNLPAVVAATKHYGGKVIIVDDGSSQADLEGLKKVIVGYGKNVELIEHTKNMGFSSAVNSGVRASSATFVVLLNSDVVPSNNFLESPLESFGNDENLCAVGFLDQSIEGTSTVKRGRGLAYWRKGLLVHEKGDIGKSDTFWVSGGSSIFKREIFLKIGGFDPIYNPFYWEDIDLSYRIQKSGFKILFDRDAIVTHHHDKGAIKTQFSKKSISRIAYRNQFIFIWKNITSSHLLASHFINLPVIILKAILRGDILLLSGLFLAVNKLPVIMSRRQKQKKLYKISDVEIIKHIS